MSHLNKQFFIGNRQALIKQSGAKLIAIAANGLMQRTSSTTLDFTQDSNFFYLTGINNPNMILVIDTVNNEDFLIAGPQTDVGIVFDGDVNQKDIAKTSGISQILENEPGWQKLDSLIKKHKKVFSIKPPDKFIPIYSMYTNPARSELIKRLKKAGAETMDIFPSISEQRVIKQTPEIANIKDAIAVTAKTFELLQSNIHTYQYEYEIHADVNALFFKQTQLPPGYESIIASGKNACTIHHVDMKSSIERAKPLLIDMGAQIDHYSADITRMFMPKADQRAEDVFQAVGELQDQAVRMIKPGVGFIDYEKGMVKHYADKLQQLGLIKDPIEKHIRKFIPHATSHYLGLDVHDVGNYRQSFKPGMVITIEPGFYIEKEGIGIRIEDNFLVTETGLENLSKNIPKRFTLQ